MPLSNTCANLVDTVIQTNRIFLRQRHKLVRNLLNTCQTLDNGKD